MKKLSIATILFFSFIISNAQNSLFTQTVKGVVLDDQSGNVLQNITVVVDNATLHLNAITDEKGNFKLLNVPVGRQNIKISAAGYEEALVPNVEVTSSKEVVLEIRLKEKV